MTTPHNQSHGDTKPARVPSGLIRVEVKYDSVYVGGMSLTIDTQDDFHFEHTYRREDVERLSQRLGGERADAVTLAFAMISELALPTINSLADRHRALAAGEIMDNR